MLAVLDPTLTCIRLTELQTSMQSELLQKKVRMLETYWIEHIKPIYFNGIFFMNFLSLLVMSNEKVVLAVFVGSLGPSFASTGVKRFVFISAADFGLANYLLQGYYEGKVFSRRIAGCF